ncbi:MAG: cell division protein CrgA [Actinomycetales bacterium]
MPESRGRKKVAYTAPSAGTAAQKPNPRWFLPVMLGFMIVGLAWIVVFYVSQGQYPLQTLGDWTVGNWNLVIGFGLMLIGFFMTTRWR